MAITLESDLVTPVQILAYQAKGMELMKNAAGALLYPELTLQEIMNTVIQFILGNAPSTADEDILKSTIKILCKDDLNNRLIEDEVISGDYINVWDKDALIDMLSKIEQGVNPTKQMYIFNNTTED